MEDTLVQLAVKRAQPDTFEHGLITVTTNGIQRINGGDLKIYNGFQTLRF